MKVGRLQPSVWGVAVNDQNDDVYPNDCLSGFKQPAFKRSYRWICVMIVRYACSFFIFEVIRVDRLVPSTAHFKHSDLVFLQHDSNVPRNSCWCYSML